MATKFSTSEQKNKNVASLNPVKRTLITVVLTEAARGDGDMQPMEMHQQLTLNVVVSLGHFSAIGHV